MDNENMGKITISLSKEDEKLLRERAETTGSNLIPVMGGIHTTEQGWIQLLKVLSSLQDVEGQAKAKYAHRS